MALVWFAAKYRHRCSACNSPIEVGDMIAKVDGAYVGLECCTGTVNASFDSLLPHGKTPKDACPKCFIVHSSMQTECE